jgi:antitoxin (DNA-binding transcriptional repressor) of toxin-antitoxin stability system
MKIITGTVTDGQIVIEGQPFAEGEQVTVLGHEGNEAFRLSPAEKRQLRESIAQADRGEFVDAEELLAELDESN